ncbi:DUF3685 domain-containing protein [Prochlorococcus sp. MIT 1341]|uniref:DUF3685 domain-containing protein n=1 Tax=Prochlorococcus sp. MIT 1341 TaxID=3096221 RepID=UPI002A747CEA|nr:DUF3685 domain-containing protein [Prochlorococcus sp. MIT 1341]
MANSSSNQILLLASDLLGESLALQLTQSDLDVEVFTKSGQLNKYPSLVIWSIETLETLTTIEIELKKLQAHWEPSPVLVLLPEKVRISAMELLKLDSPGLLQAPDLKTLKEAIKTLLQGGRVVRLKDNANSIAVPRSMPLGLSHWLLRTALKQINTDLKHIEDILNHKTSNKLAILVIEGRRRELQSAKSLVLWLWGPIHEPNSSNINVSGAKQLTNADESNNRYGTNITLKERNSIAVWKAINERLQAVLEEQITNSTGTILAIESLNLSRQKDLLVALLNQLHKVMQKLMDGNKSDQSIEQIWSNIQIEIRQQSIRKMIGSYLQITKGNELKPLGEQLLRITDLSESDEELPEPSRMLAPLLLNKPVLVDGQLLPADDPRAVMQLEILTSNWLIRTAELISAEILDACGEWPELRRHMLCQQLISTRELERFRNQLNSQARWQNLIQRPIRLYESKRLLFRFLNKSIQPLMLTEPRDEELRQLGWWQQQVALIVETRDALAPQIQSVVKHFGDLMVIILTQVVGRAIGLVGRGIAQGMGRSLTRSS